MLTTKQRSLYRLVDNEWAKGFIKSPSLDNLFSGRCDNLAVCLGRTSLIEYQRYPKYKFLEINFFFLVSFISLFVLVLRVKEIRTGLIARRGAQFKTY